jgi:hypothetical protein
LPRPLRVPYTKAGARALVGCLTQDGQDFVGGARASGLRVTPDCHARWLRLLSLHAETSATQATTLAGLPHAWEAR